ncbi:MAG: hypothetical protein HDT20_08800 [Oscillibacter sp.]|nr:hypothetical protein [Oscillibacter sp.]
MRIQNGVPNYLTSAQKTRTTSRTTGSTFGQQLDIAATRSGDRCEINYPKNRIKPDSEWELSPYVNLMVAHDQWKEQQPPQELPDSQGWTEENIAYLRERYSGSLSWEERVDMLETMKDMGMITREQWNSVYGDSLITEKLDLTTGRFVLQPEMEAKLEAFRRSHPWNQDWNVYFQVDPISSFQTADDVLAWMAQPEGGSTGAAPTSLPVGRSADRYAVNFPKNQTQPDDEGELSPYMNLTIAYDQWKEQQPPQELPDSQGRTAENIAYLKEHYSGSLSWEERVDMLETMKDMGMITREQRNSAYGDSLITLRIDLTTGKFVPQPEMEAKIEAYRRNHPWNQDWDVYFSVDPISSFQTADDVLAWMDQLEGGSTGAARTSQPVSQSTATSAAGNNGLITGLSPYVRLMNSYENWKAQQPPLDLPDSSGSTEELLAWLKEHYTGDLSWEERIDALNTAMDLGVITRDQRNEALGGGMVTFSGLDAVKVQFMAWTVGKQITNPAFFSDDWDVNLAHFTASSFKTADDFFAWLDEILARDGSDDDIPTEEAPKVEISAGETAQAE